MKETFVTLEFPYSELSFYSVQSSNSNMNIFPILGSVSAAFRFIPFFCGHRRTYKRIQNVMFLYGLICTRWLLDLNACNQPITPSVLPDY